MKRNEPALASIVRGVLKPHHSLLRKDVARAAELSGAVVVEQKPPLCRTLLPLYRLFQEFRRELDDHLDAQETALFPRLLELEASLRAGERPPADADAVAEALRLLKYGQTLLTGVLDEMRELTQGFSAPPGACECYGELLDVLAAIQMEMDSEVRLEKSILVPEASELLDQVRDSEPSRGAAAGNIGQS